MMRDHDSTSIKTAPFDFQITVRTYRILAC